MISGARPPLADLEHDILAHLREAGGPVGSGQLYLSLKKKYQIGQASIGRKLAEFDRAALTRRVGYRGRIITRKGLRKLEQLRQHIARRKNHQDLLGSLDASNFARLMEVLGVRKVLEREGARAAAENATPEEIRRLEETLEEQRRLLLAGDEDAASARDMDFHDLIASASRNEVLRHTLKLVAAESIFSPYTSQMRARAGGKLFVEHLEILEFLRARDAEGAAAAMAAHIDGVMQDVMRFWGKERGAAGGCGDGTRRR